MVVEKQTQKLREKFNCESQDTHQDIEVARRDTEATRHGPACKLHIGS
jgi:hypothetical protein